MLARDSLDCSYPWDRMCHYGYIFHLSCRIQLPGGNLPSTRQLRISSSVLLLVTLIRKSSSHIDLQPHQPIFLSQPHLFKDFSSLLPALCPPKTPLTAPFLGRIMFGGVFPVLAQPMFSRLTYSGASSLLGGAVNSPPPPLFLPSISLPINSPFPKLRLHYQPNLPKGALLTIVPWVLYFYGPRIRARSKFATVCFNFLFLPFLLFFFS